MKRILTAYFSASGVTKAAAEKLAKAIGSDLFEIEPEVPYTKSDLNWMNKNSRSSLEMKDPSSRPAIKAVCPDMEKYDVVFVGFPIWWYVAPTIVNTFLEAHDMRGKTVIPFATSGGSGMGKTNDALRPSLKDSKLLEGRIVNRMSEEALKAWAETLGV